MVTLSEMPRSKVDYDDPKAVADLTARVREVPLDMNFVTEGAPVEPTPSRVPSAKSWRGLAFALRALGGLAVIAAGVSAPRWTTHSRAALIIVSGIAGISAGMIFPPLRFRRR